MSKTGTTKLRFCLRGYFFMQNSNLTSKGAGNLKNKAKNNKKWSTRSAALAVRPSNKLLLWTLRSERY